MFVNVKILEGISDIRDESDRNGMRVVIEVLNCFLYTLICASKFHSGG